MKPPALSLLSRLWLREPDAKTLADASEARLPCDDGPAEIAPAWTDCFLLNVYPYGSAFLDPSGELNGPSAATVLARFETASYTPPELAEAGAPDHVGLCLGFLDHLDRTGRDPAGFLAWAQDWIPVCALAVERQPSAHPFYGAVAAATSEALLSRGTVSSDGRATPLDQPSEEEELGLSAVIRRLLAPAVSGFFLSRSRLGRIALDAGMRLPFSSRRDVARALFESAGDGGRIERVLEGLLREAQAWEEAYAAIAARYPAWEARAGLWRSRLAGSRDLLADMAGILDTPHEVEYGSAEQIGGGGP